ncbi:AEC family transporter [Clostridiaceae bacterium]|nr:AEC family transporter [Clostridiaceae bacterium]RKI16543.1 AEC family transporter [bacterium 1XD21-70]
MSSFQTAVAAVLPMFIMLVLGWYLRKIRMTDEPMLNKLNTVCFRAFLAVNVYYNIYKVNIKEVFRARLLLYAIATQVVILLFSLLVAMVTEKTKKKRGALSHGIFHTNFVIFGTLIGTALCGEGNIGGISLLIAVIVPVQNIFSVVLLELFRENSKLSVKKTLGGVLKNPYVIAAAAGFLTQLFPVRYPDVIANVFRDLGRCGTPVALIVMGGLFNFGAVRENAKAILVGSLARLVVVPAVLIAVTVALGFRGEEFIALMCIFIAPCATTSFNLASAMDSDADLAAQLVVFTSLFSLMTIFLWIFALSQLGIF